MNREQISERDIKYLLVAQWLAKLCILFPIVLSGLGLGDAVRSIAVGILLWCLVIGIAQKWIRPGQDLFQTLERQVGRKASLIFCAVSLWYFLAHTAVFARLWTELLRTYLTPAIPAAILCLVPLAAGLMYSGKGLKSCTRANRYMGIALLILTAVLACLAGNEIPVGACRGKMAVDSAAQMSAGGTLQAQIDSIVEIADGFTRSAYEVFLCIGGLFLPLLSGHFARKREGKNNGWPIRRTGCVCAAVAGMLCIAVGFSGTAPGWRAADFPAIEAMRTLRPFGIYIGRLETVLALFLLAGLTMTVAGGFWCVRESFDCLYAIGATLYYEYASDRLRKKIPDVQKENELYGTEFAEELPVRPVPRFHEIKRMKRAFDFPHSEKLPSYAGRIYDALSPVRVWWWIVVLVVYVLTVGFADAFAAVTFYRAYNMQVLAPVMLVFYVVSSGIVRERRRTATAASVMNSDRSGAAQDS